MATPYPRGLRWVATQLVPPRSELRRVGDRLEVVARWLVLLAVLAAVPFALAAGSEVQVSVARSITVEHAERHPVQAEVLPPTNPEVAPSTDRRIGSVRWTAPDGSVHVGRTVLDLVERPGDRTTVWLDRAGGITRPPRAWAEAPTDGIVTALGLLAAVAALGLTVLGLLRRLLDRRHLRDWDAAWRRFTVPGAGSVR